ncbi:DUF533 domain-containing protein [Salipiger sp. 1_MG-2023]|uniref:DUF533 domain-containing protein n=1 Tax=Salipiger sp. 1_MG-2023 TaxID=3062665 RepID=UPI0026E277F3|nr:DUF533 domain-containing protein [Salipiger sp. 1_MG-2023]MDO6585492.1 DUF533 domain-containing protein [Salipiger sp. 1_MG-2023]
MSLMNTLTKLALGYAAARGVDKLSKGQGLAGLLGGGAQLKGSEPGTAEQAQAAKALTGPAANPMQNIMSQIQQGGLGALFKDQGGLMAMAGSVMGAAGVSGMIDKANAAAAQPQTEEAAHLMLRAMIQAARADGHIDEAERKRIIDTVGEDAPPEDLATLRALLDAPSDPEALARDTPEPLRAQVYGAALLTITVDTDEEAEFLDRLGKAMELPEIAINQIHMQMGLQPLYH